MNKNILEFCLSPDLGGLELYVQKISSFLNSRINLTCVINEKGKLTTAFEENNLNQELIEKIIKNEKVVTFEDLIVRRLSLYSENRLSQGQQEILNKFK